MARLGRTTPNQQHQPLPQPYNDAGEGPAPPTPGSASSTDQTAVIYAAHISQT